MQSEKFDNKIQQAAEQHHPDYDEKAWTKMEKLLNRHLPQKDDRRRRVIFFLLFFLLTGGGAWLVISKPWQQNDPTLSTVNKTAKNEDKSPAGSVKEIQDVNTTVNKKTNKEIITAPVTESPVIVNEKKDVKTIKDDGRNKQGNGQDFVATDKKIVGNTYKQDKALPVKNNTGEQLITPIDNPEKVKKDKNLSANVNTTIVSSTSNSNNDKASGNDKIKIPADLPVNNDISVSKNSETKKDNITEEPKVADKKDIAKKSRSKKGNSFFFSFSVAPDVSSIGMENPGKMKLLSGAGFGYTFKDRLTIRTGFYTGRKIYSASRYEYKPDITPPNYNYIDKIDADCKVYEIPVNLSYNFSRSNKHSLFASAGLSSYIMKKEKYVYLYKYSNGSTYSYTKSVNDENKHYFSVLTLSAGYEHKISKTFSIAAEPYIKFPLAGVGYGKVKLNSAGILFSVNINPFHTAIKK